MQRIFLLTFFLLISGCLSRSDWEQRFEESSHLSAPVFSVSLPDPEQYSFAMVGDLHLGGAESGAWFERMLQAAQAEGDAFIVLLGDLADKGERESFLVVQDALKASGFENKVISILGNHDIFNQGWEDYKSLFGPSHFSLEVGNSRFIAIDSADGIIGEKQMEWLLEQLNGSRASKTFILSHYMPVVPGQRTYLRLSNQLEAERVMNFATQARVSGFFGGHYHSYCQEKIAGVDYVVAGGGGGRKMKPIETNFFIQVNVSPQGVTHQLKLLN